MSFQEKIKQDLKKRLESKSNEYYKMKQSVPTVIDIDSAIEVFYIFYAEDQKEHERHSLI